MPPLIAGRLSKRTRPRATLMPRVLKPTHVRLTLPLRPLISLSSLTGSMKLRDEEKVPILVSKLTSSLADRV
jgi:hypothetical protein